MLKGGRRRWEEKVWFSLRFFIHGGTAKTISNRVSYFTLETGIFQEIWKRVSLDFPHNLWYRVLLERQVNTMTTLENLYYGNIAPYDYEVPRGSEYYVTAQLVVRHENELFTTLTEQQKEILQKIKDNHTNLLCLSERDAFCRGFSLAVKLIKEAMSDKT